MLTFFGLKPSRYTQWLRVVRDEGRKIGLRGLIVAFVASARGGRVDRSVYRRRLRECAECPVYDVSRRACRNGTLGCGCYMPIKAAFKGNQCWGRGILPGGPFGHSV